VLTNAGAVSVADPRGLTHYPGLGNNFMHTEVQSRYRTHGGLTPPALVLVCGRLPMEKRFLRCTNAYYQERRALARRGSETAFATATVYRGESTFRPWTRLARATIENRNRSAAIVGEQERRASARRGRDKRSGAEKRISRAWRASESGAAGVSPPWFRETAFATATVYRGEARFDRGPGSHELQSRIAIDQRQSSVNRSGGR
jgi:hypothetical protein